MTAPDARRVLRQTMRARREALPPRVRLGAAEALADALRHWPPFIAARRVAGYWAVRGELPLHALLVPPLAFDYHLPVLQPGNTLRFAPWRTGGALRSNEFGIPEPDVASTQLREPEQLDLVLVPLVAFDRGGARLGSGAGYYDRSFAFLREQARPARPRLLGIAYGFQEVERLPVEAWDVPLDAVATEAGVIECG